VSELRLSGVSVRFGSRRNGLTAVDGVDLVVPSGSVVGLVGESGSGKSTLARAAVGLVPVSSGHILLDGQPLHGRSLRGQSRALGARRPVQMVFQDPHSSLDPRMTAGESVAEAIPRGAFSRAARRAESERLLDLVGLPEDSAAAYPARLSGGQRQRVALARALAGQPEVIIADEITSALDVSTQGAVLNVVTDLQRQLRLSMLFISHNLAVVKYVSDIVAVMYLGRIVECGPAEAVLSDPQHPYTRELLAAAPQPGGSLDGETIDPAPADPHHPPAGCHFHPRCPVGPLIHDDRDICQRARPSGSERRHSAACHFAPPDQEKS
jgi:peptide/nickel transport system ATP-binding protein